MAINARMDLSKCVVVVASVACAAVGCFSGSDAASDAGTPAEASIPETGSSEAGPKALPGEGGTEGGLVCADGGASVPEGAVVFTVDLHKGPKRVFNPPTAPVPVSPYVYGVNSFAAWNPTTKWGMLRWGGDSTTPLNWTNNFSNAGSDYCFNQGNEDKGSTALAGTITTGTPSIITDKAIGAASLVTVPIVPYVASSAVTNNVWSGSIPPCPGTPMCASGTANGTAMNVGNLDFASTDSASSAFVTNHPTKGSAFCTSTSGSCSVDTTGPVYQDEFVNYMKVNYASDAPIFFMLDNEPNYWPGTHPEIWPYTGTPGCGTSGTVSFDDVVTLNTSFATAIKNAWPEALVFGPVVAQDGILYAGDYDDPNLPTPFGPYYLSKMAANSDEVGHPLIDSFDTHYYTSNSQTTSQCLQVPRMFWDPNFTDFTASTTDSIDFGWSGPNNYFDTNLFPRQMIPRVEGWIATAYQGKKTAAPGYSISEYDFGGMCDTAIEGGVAEADLLGVFGREGLFGATMWPLQSVLETGSSALALYSVAAFDLYRNYDGKGSVVGDTAVYASTPDVEHTSIYAFTSSTQAGEVDLVAVNKTADSLPFVATLANAPSLTQATAYQLVAGTIGVTLAAGSPPTVTCSGGTIYVTYTMPATSATTIILR
jgi:hypothetical protein